MAQTTKILSNCITGNDNDRWEKLSLPYWSRLRPIHSKTREHSNSPKALSCPLCNGVILQLLFSKDQRPIVLRKLNKLTCQKCIHRAAKSSKWEYSLFWSHPILSRSTQEIRPSMTVKTLFLKISAQKYGRTLVDPNIKNWKPAGTRVECWSSLAVLPSINWSVIELFSICNLSSIKRGSTKS